MEKIIHMPIGELSPHPRNAEFFDDIDGEKWQEFKDSISASGVIEPIVITQDNVVVSGHQRVRACRELGIDEIPCCQRSYESEDQILQDLIETNIRQRGDIGGSAKKIGKRIIELERLYGIRRGRPSENEKSCEFHKIKASQKGLAEKLGMSQWTLNNYKKLVNMIPELENLVDTGIVTTNTALAIMRELSPEDQKAFLESLPEVDKLTEKRTQELMDDYKEKIKILENAAGESEKFREKYLKANDELHELKEHLGRNKNVQSAEMEIQLLTASLNEMVKRHGGKVWAFNEWVNMDETVREPFFKALDMTEAFVKQLRTNLQNAQAAQEAANPAPKPSKTLEIWTKLAKAEKAEAENAEAELEIVEAEVVYSPDVMLPFETDEEFRKRIAQEKGARHVGQ